jgi:hypothetical protein
MSSKRVAWSGAAIILLVSATAVANAGELPKIATVLDPDCIFYLWPYPAISPDGQWVAYVSKGNVCICNIKTAARRQVMEVPHSWTWPHLKAAAERSPSSGTFAALSRGLSRDEYNELHAQITNTVYGLNWTNDCAGFVFGVQAYDAKQKISIYDGYYASVTGETNTLTHVRSDSPTRAVCSGILTQDRKYLVSADLQMAHADYRPLIWNVTENKPRATCFLYLVPSKTSGRWIGIEKDTQQLVITDEQFEVTRRFNEQTPDRSFGFRLDWSPNERFIIWRNQIGFDHFSNWEGFHMNLETGAKRALEGRFMDEQIGFTGRGGEFYRCGQTGAKTNWYDAIVGAHLSIAPEADGEPKDAWRLTLDPNKPRPGMMTNRPGNPPLHLSPDAKLFAIGLPRPAGETSGMIWHLLDRDGTAWRFPGDDNGEYVSPYEVVGFADGGEVIVAHDSAQLFSLPVSNVVDDSNRIK